MNILVPYDLELRALFQRLDKFDYAQNFAIAQQTLKVGMIGFIALDNISCGSITD